MSKKQLNQRQPPLAYDYKRDGDLKEGEAVITYEDGSTERIMESECYRYNHVDELTPSQDLKALILAEHRRAELQRLDDGWSGCGCADCQELYRTLDLSGYGSRVSETGDIILIDEDKKSWQRCLTTGRLRAVKYT